jgi:hypothetical protein
MKHILVILFGFIFVMSSCVHHKTKSHAGISTGKVEFVCVPVVGNKPFYFDSIYKTPAGETYTVNNLKFFLSDIAFSRSDIAERSAQSATAVHGVYLADFTQTIQDTMPGKLRYKASFEMQTGAYSDIRFNIGIPRLLNHGDPTQAPSPLDIGNADMFWEWNSGYIFFLLEGKSNYAEDSILHIAVGGDSRIMPVSFGDLFNAVPLVRVEEDVSTRIYFKLDLNRMFINADGSFYSFKPEEAAIVHGGHYADKMRLNILQALEFVAVENIPVK